MTAVHFCPTCGVQRMPSARHCANCGLDYWKLAETGIAPEAPKSAGEGSGVLPPDTVIPLVAPEATQSETVGLLAGLSWIGSAVAMGYLAFLQLQYSSLGLVGSRDAGTLAIWNGVAAAITAFFGARLILGATRRFLANSIGWAVLNVAWGVYQISQGVSAGAFLIATLLAGIAGVLSFVAWQQKPEQKV